MKSFLSLNRRAGLTLRLLFFFSYPVACVCAAELDPDVAATVNGQPVYVRQVERLVQQALGDRHPANTLRNDLRRAALERLIDRHAILIYLQKRHEAASENEVNNALSELSAQLARTDEKLDDYLAKHQLTEPMLRAELRWRITWQHQLDKYMTDENLKRFFDQHKRMFDGTKLKVAEILKKVDDATDQQRQAAIAELQRVRNEIVSGKLSFAEAARKYSDAPTAAAGGMLGWLGHAGPMPPIFTDAAFKLRVGEISPPVSTPVGVHLIQCCAERPGKKTWQEMRPELKQAVRKYVFQWLAKRARPACKVTFNTTLSWWAGTAGS